MKIKKIIAMLSAVALFGAMAGCGTNKAENDMEKPTETVTATDAPTENKTDGSDAIVVYFSRAGEQYKVGNIDKGNTAVVAQMIADKTGADMFGIIPAEDNYPTDSYDALTEYAKQEQNNNARPEIMGGVSRFDQYDTVFLGYPIWWGDLPMIVYTFLESYDFSGKTVIPFCTHEGSGNAGTASTIKSKLPNATVTDYLAVYGSAAQKNDAALKTTIDSWLEKLGYIK